MNRVRMCILRQMWNEQKQAMIKNLKKGTTKKKDALRKKRLNKLLRLTDEVREVALKNYFHYCKEKAAKIFIDWRVE